MSNRFPKSVSFNHTNEIDKKILKHVKSKNFSGYVKKLILEDIERDAIKVVQKSENGGIRIVVEG